MNKRTFGSELDASHEPRARAFGVCVYVVVEVHLALEQLLRGHDVRLGVLQHDVLVTLEHAPEHGSEVTRAEWFG